MRNILHRGRGEKKNPIVIPINIKYNILTVRDSAQACNVVICVNFSCAKESDVVKYRNIVHIYFFLNS